MANDPSVKDTTANTMLDAITTAISTSGKLRIYTASKPTNADTALGAQTVVAELPLSATFAPGASGGVLTASSITNDTNAVGGTAAWFSLVTSGGTRIVDGTCGTSGADLNLNSLTIGAGATVSVTSLTITIN